MSTELIAMAKTLAVRLGVDQGVDLIKTLKATAFKGQASDEQFIALLIVANQYGLNPWTREIYAFPDRQNGIVPVVGVDGWLRIINENKMFNGMDLELDEKSCTCTIYRKDRDHAIKITEFMDECFREPFLTKDGRKINGPWQSHPKRMLRHKAMIQCARIAFGFGGIFDQDEAERVIEGTVVEVSEGKQSNDERPALIANAETAALKGCEALKNHWLSLSESEKLIIGNSEKKRLYQISKKIDEDQTAEVIYESA